MNLAQLVGRAPDDLVDRTPRLSSAPAPVWRTVIRHQEVEHHRQEYAKPGGGLASRIRSYLAREGRLCSFDEICVAVERAELEQRPAVSGVMHELTKRQHVTRTGRRGSPSYQITQHGRDLVS